MGGMCAPLDGVLGSGSGIKLTLKQKNSLAREGNRSHFIARYIKKTVFHDASQLENCAAIQLL